MTRFLDVGTVGKMLSAIGLEKALGAMACYILDDYKRWVEFEKSARVAAHSELGVIELMPATDGKMYGFKYVNGHPRNIERDLSTVMAFGVLADVNTGYPVLLSEMTLLTAVRTAATSAAVAKVLARKSSKSMAVIGNGAQSEFQILAFKELLGIDEVRLYDIDPEATSKLCRNLKSVRNLKVVRASSSHEAVRGADIITTITADKMRAVILSADMIEPGVHINAVGGDCPGKTELHADVLKMGAVFVEYEPQTRIEGDIQQMPADFPVTELWEVVTGKKKGRINDTQITIFDSVGFALEDFSALRYINDMAPEMNAGVIIDLVPKLENPKDLYSLLRPKALPIVPKTKANADVKPDALELF